MFHSIFSIVLNSNNIYVHNTNVTKALQVVDLEMPASPEKVYILEFIKSSEKGIIRGIS